MMDIRKPSSPQLSTRNLDAQSLTNSLRGLRSSLAAGVKNILIERMTSDITSITTLITRRSFEKLSKKDKKLIEQEGRELWNACIRRRRQVNETADLPRALAKARLLAFRIIKYGRETLEQCRDTQSTTIEYMMGLAVVVARLCLEVSELDSAKEALQALAEYIDRLKSRLTATNNYNYKQRKLNVEAVYYTLRMILARSDNQADLAEHMYQKLEEIIPYLDLETMFYSSDTMSYIGRGLLEKGDRHTALQWFRRAYYTIAEPIFLVSTANIIKIHHAFDDFVQAMLQAASDEHLAEASQIVCSIEKRWGISPITMHWSIQILRKSQPEGFDNSSIGKLIERTIDSSDITKQNIGLLLHYINVIGADDLALAMSLLDKLQASVIIPNHSPKSQELLNMCILRRVWLVTTDTKQDGFHFVSDLRRTLMSLYDIISGPLEAETASAVHLLIWKKTNAALVERRFKTVQQWCSIALHEIFSADGGANWGKFGRRMIMAAIELKDAEKAKGTFESMPETTQNEISTQYLMFKVSLIDWDHQLGYQCLMNISRRSNEAQSQDMLYACIKEAQQAGDRICTLSALKAVAEGCNTKQHWVHGLPSVLRCSIRLINWLDTEEQPREKSGLDETSAEDTCRAFERESAKKRPRDLQGELVFTKYELDWFRKNSYNIGLSKCSTWALGFLIRLFNCCLIFIDCYSDNTAQSRCEAETLVIMAMRCHFIVAAALVSVARTANEVDEQLQRYLEMGQHIAAFDQLLHTTVGTQDEEIVRDLYLKFSSLLVFDFEGAVALKRWDELRRIVKQVEICQDDGALKAMGDCLLRSQAPGEIMHSTLRIIINGIYTLENFDSAMLAKYMRCLFQVTLPLDTSLALSLVDETLGVTQECKQVGEAWPENELDWLVAMTFNHAIDLYARGEEEMCQKWALKAMELAAYMKDDGQMKLLLEAKFSKLRFQNALS